MVKKKDWNLPEITALLAVVLGFIAEIAPFLFLSISPPLALVSPITIGSFTFPAYQVYGLILIVGGGLYLIWRRKR